MILLLQAGNAVNFFGYGLIIPFEMAFFEEGRPQYDRRVHLRGRV